MISSTSSGAANAIIIVFTLIWMAVLIKHWRTTLLYGGVLAGVMVVMFTLHSFFA